MNREQAEEVSESLIQRQRSELSAAAENRRAREASRILRQKIAVFGLVGAGFGAVVGELSLEAWSIGLLAGLGMGALIGRVCISRVRAKL